MIEKTILDYLSDCLPDVPVYMEVPADRPAVFVVIEKTGSSRINHIDSATIAVQSYGATLYDAAALNERVKTAMLDSITLDSISRAALNSDYNYTDTASKHYRYQAVFDVTFYDD